MFKRKEEKAVFVPSSRRKSSRQAVDAVQLVPHQRRKSRIVAPFRRKFASVPFSTIR